MMDERFTIHAQEILKQAREKASRLGSKFVDTEHLFYALVEEEKCLGTTVIYYLGMDPHSLRLEILQRIEPRKHEFPLDEVQYSPETRRIIGLAVKEAEGLCDKCIGSEHLLLGMIREGDGIAAKILLEHQINLVKARREILRQKKRIKRSGRSPGKSLSPLAGFQGKGQF